MSDITLKLSAFNVSTILNTLGFRIQTIAEKRDGTLWIEYSEMVRTYNDIKEAMDEESWREYCEMYGYPIDHDAESMIDFPAS